METQDIIALSVLFGVGLIGFILNVIEWFIEYILLRKPVDEEIGNLDAFLIGLFFFIFCLCPPFGWIVTGATIARQLNYVFHFWKDK